MNKYRHTTLLIPPEDRTRLEEIARNLGCVQTRGAGTGEMGSISALICAIARGEYALVQKKSKESDGDSEYSRVESSIRAKKEII